MNKLILNRKMYENIRRLNHREMQVYLSEIQEAAYKAGYEEAVKDTPTAAELIRAVAAKRNKGHRRNKCIETDTLCRAKENINKRRSGRIVSEDLRNFEEGFY